MAQTCRLRLVVANDPRSYREAIATAIQRLQPDVEVMVVDVAGEQTWARDIDLAELLAIVDRTAALVGLGLYSI